MVSRKVQRTGGSTLTVSLPKEWVEGKVEEGEEVFLTQENEDIRISFDESDEEKTVLMDCPENFEIAKRRIVALYLNGIDRIIVRNRKGDLQRYVRENLIGMETVEVDSDKLEIRNLFSESEMPAENGLRRMSSLISSMMADIAEEQRKEDIEQREQILDRYYLLELRQLHLSLSDSEFRDSIGLDSTLQAMEYRVIAKSMERIGDHLTELAGEEPVGELGDANKVFKNLRNGLFQADTEKIEETIPEIKEIHIGEHGEQKERSMRRIKRLMLDISEAAINYSIEPDKRLFENS